MPPPIVAVGAALAALCLAAPAAARGAVEAGRVEYRDNCAVCHGFDARGEGPLAMLLKVAPTDLTTLTRGNDGRFPFERVYRIIDGRGAVAAHGPREMPVWGREYAAEAPGREGHFFGPLDPEVYATGRILALIRYLQSVQR